MNRLGRRTALPLMALPLAVIVFVVPTATSTAAASPLCLGALPCADRSAPLPAEPDPGPSTTAPEGSAVSPGPVSPTVPSAPRPSPTGPTPAESPGPAESSGPTEPPGLAESPGPAESPAPSESPTETPAPSESPSSPPPVEASEDDEAPVFSPTPASMGSESLSFTGLSGIEIVTVPTTGGDSMRVLKISADSITISGFSLTVRPPEEDVAGLVTKADTMKLEGDVTVYIGSITATTKDGSSLTIGTDTQPPLDEVEPGLLRVTMGLVGTFADTITYENTDQEIVAP